MKVIVISAIVAISIFAPLLYLGGYYFYIAMGILSILAYREIVNLKVSHSKLDIPMIVLGGILTLFICLYDCKSSYIFNISYIKLLLPMVLLLIPSVFAKEDTYKTSDAFYLLGSIYFIGFLFHLTIIIRNINMFLLLYLMLIPILNDTFAYLIGVKFGKHKMIPSVSPKKSWDGAIGGLLLGSICSNLFYYLCVTPNHITLSVILTTIVLSVVGQISDLVFSKIKRENQIKDFSNIMPGHGGILDRLDSYSLVLFTYIVIVSIL